MRRRSWTATLPPSTRSDGWWFGCSASGVQPIGQIGRGHDRLEEIEKRQGGGRGQPPPSLGPPDPPSRKAFHGEGLEPGPQIGGNGRGGQNRRSISLEGQRGNQPEPIALGGGIQRDP